MANEIREGRFVAVAVDLDELVKVTQAATTDFRRIQTFAYAISDIVGQPRGNGPADSELKASTVVVHFLDNLSKQAQRLYDAQREPFHL